MEYVNLALACALFSLQFVFTKGFSARCTNAPHAGLWNGCVISLLMLCYLLPMNGFRFDLSAPAVRYALLYALCGVGMNAINIFAMRLGALSTVSTYTLLGGMVLPFIYGVVALNEACSPLKILAIVVLMAAIVPTMLQKTEQKTQSGMGKRVLFHGLCLLLFCANGLVSIVTKAHSISPDAISSGAFTLLCAAVQVALGLLVLLGFAAAKTVKNKKSAFGAIFLDVTRQKPTTPRLLLVMMCFGLGYALCNGVANIFSQNCARVMDASIQFPVISAAVIVLTALLGRVCFGEKISRTSALSLSLSLCGAVLFMIA